jgi:hypothetical protein
MDISTSGLVLKGAFDAVQAPLEDSDDDYSIATSIGPGYLARARSGAATVLIPLASAPSAVGRHGGGFSLVPAARVAFCYADRRWEQAAAVLQCTDATLIDTFIVLVLDLARRLKSTIAGASWLDVLEWMEDWQSLLGRSATLSTEQQLGLWGELWLIANAAVPDLLVAAWRGPDGEAVDYYLDGIGLEIKVSKRAHTHYVSQRQLDFPVGRAPAYLLSVWVVPEPAHGVALSELIESLLPRMSDAAGFLRQLAVVGYLPKDRQMYTTRYAVLDAPLWYRTENVPRVRAVDVGISQIRYLVTLDLDHAVEEDAAKSLWRHFCKLEPKFSSDTAKQ